MQRDYRARNPEKTREWARLGMARRRQQNPEAFREYMRRWRADNADLVTASKSAWAEKNYERLREAANAANARYKAAYPDRRREHDLRRRARKRGAVVMPADLIAIWESQEGLCALCATPIDRSLAWPDPMSPSVDHIVPLALGGEHAPSNLQWTHLRENLAKGASLQ